MRRAATALVASVAISAGAPAPAPAASEGPVRAAAPPAWVKLKSCSNAKHKAVFVARMRRIPGVARMKLRMAVLERGRGGRWSDVTPRALRKWFSTRGYKAALQHKARVRGLRAGASYRVKVRYRWYDGSDNLVRRARRRSRACRQTGRVPNLRVRVLRARRTGTAGVWRYRIKLANTGRALAANAMVGLSIDGAELDTRTVPLLRARNSTVVTFRGPACRSQMLATADPSDAVRESSETDNRDSAACAEVRP